MKRDLGFDRRQGWLVVVLGAIAVTAAVAARLSRGVELTESFDTGSSIPFTGTAAVPPALAAAGAGQLFEWLAMLGWLTLAIGAATLLASWADWTARSRPEIRLRRAVGASRGTLSGALARRSVGWTTLAVSAGIAIGTILTWQSRGNWPMGAWPWRGVAITAGVAAAVLLLGTVIPLLELRRRPLTALDPAPPPLGIAAGQLGIAFAFIVGGAMLIGQSSAMTPAGVSRLPLDATIQRADLSAVGSDSGRVSTVAGMLRDGHRNPGLVSVTNEGGHLGAGTVDELLTDCGQCFVGGIYLRWRRVRAAYLTASADTFAARGMALLAGRAFGDADGPQSELVAVVNQHLGRRYFQDGNPIGRFIYPAGWLGGPAYRVVGMVEDGAPIGLTGTGRPLETVYLSSLQHPSATMEVLVSGVGSRPAGPGLERPRPAETVVREARAPHAWFGAWFIGLGSAGLLLALAGTALLMAAWTRAMRDELAVRRAVGATRRSVVLLVLATAARTGVQGVGIGLVFVGPVLWPELARLAPGMSYWQPPLVIAAAALLIATAVLAATVPALDAGRGAPASLWQP